MSTFLNIGMIAGGLGLFLLSVRMITDGMKLAAGGALNDVLGRCTSTPLRGLTSGALITGLVQSSSTVTVATIGFVNAGLLSFISALGVVYGANIGTTVTAWLVAGIGFSISFGAFAYPLIGGGMLLRLLNQNERLVAIGETLAGFGLFFMAIGILKTAFFETASAINIETLPHDGATGLIIFVGAGFVVTTLLQSSSASGALILTATIGNVIPLENAAAMIIGANVGTTSTALIAAIGATPNAKRVAAAHIIFNLLTGAVALIMLPGLMWVVTRSEMSWMLAHPAVTLAAFHTLFNCFGVILLWPATQFLGRQLQHRFRTKEEDEARPRFLDKSLIETPEIAVQTLVRELGHMGEIARHASYEALLGGRSVLPKLKNRRVSVREIAVAIGEFTEELRRQNLSAATSGMLPVVLRVVQYHEQTAVLAERTFAVRTALERKSLHAKIPPTHDLYSSAARVITAAETESKDFTVEALSTEVADFLDSYQKMKERLLRAGADQNLPIADLSTVLDQISRVRRMVEQAVKAARHLNSLREIETGEGISETSPE